MGTNESPLDKKSSSSVCVRVMLLRLWTGGFGGGGFGINNDLVWGI